MTHKALFLVSTSLLLCHLISPFPLLLAQVHSGLPTPSTVIIKADSQQKSGEQYQLEGHVEITDGTMRLTADRMEYQAASGDAVAVGNVHFFRSVEQEDLHASRAEYNLRAGTGRFFEVQGSIGAQLRTDSSLLTSTNPFFFVAERVDRVEGNQYVVWNGQVTVCTMPDPTWTFFARKAVIEPGVSARVYNGDFRLFKVPLLYFPFLYRSLRRIPRSTGFLIPSVGNNSRLGTVIGDSFFWAINRSTDLELGAEFLSKRGWSQQATFRARPNPGSYLGVSYFGVMDRGFGPQKVDQGGRMVRASGVAELPAKFRGILDFSYLSSLTFREAFTQNYAEAVNSEAHTTASLTKSFDSFRFGALFSRFENFQSIQPKDKVRIDRLPQFEFNSVERPLLSGFPLWISWDSSAGAVSRTEPARGPEPILRTNTLERLIFAPRLTLPWRWKGFRFTPVLGWRGIHYGKQQRDTQVVDESLHRNLGEVSLELAPPALTRVFSGAGPLSHRPFQHVLEPRITVRAAFGAGDFPKALLFDEQDRMTNTREVDYSLTHRLLLQGSGGSAAKEIFSWELRQKYYLEPDFGGALVPGRRNVFDSTLDLSGAAFLDAPRRFSPIISVLRVRPSPNYDLEFHGDYDTIQHHFTHGGLVASARRGYAFASVSQSFVRSSPALSPPSNQIGFSLGYGSLSRVGWNAAFAGAYDVRADFLQFSAVQISYNNNCCGISLEFRRFALGPVRNENQFRVAFSLANIGTFGTLKKQERLF